MIAEGLDSLFENASELDVLFNPEKVMQIKSGKANPIGVSITWWDYCGWYCCRDESQGDFGGL